jgi:hypothetical protein
MGAIWSWRVPRKTNTGRYKVAANQEVERIIASSRLALGEQAIAEALNR